MSRIASFGACFVALVVTAVGCDRRPVGPSTPHPDPIVGVWRVVSIEHKKVSDLGFRLIWTITPEEIAVSDSAGGKVSRSRYRTDPAQMPKQIDMEIRDLVEEHRRGIYEVDGDRLRLLFSIGGGPRLTKWDEGQMLLLERVAAANP